MELTGAITMEPDEAQAQLEALKAHEKHLTAEERAMVEGYRTLARGRKIVDLRKAVVAGGAFDERPWGPRLAVARAGLDWVHLWRWQDGRFGFASNDTGLDGGGRRSAWSMEFPTGFNLPRLDPSEWGVRGTYRAMVPAVPVRERMRLARPRAGGWRSCLILFEVGEWAKAPRPPGDPALLRHLAGWLYTVEATWDLTELEQAVLAGRPT